MPSSRPTVAVGSFPTKSAAQAEVRKLNGRARTGQPVWGYKALAGRHAIVVVGTCP